jgi:hypothetical protein
MVEATSRISEDHMSVTLDKDTVLRAFCYCREAERSVHRALGANWAEFGEYYAPSKRADISSLIDHLGNLAGPRFNNDVQPTADEVGRHVREPGIVRYFLGPWIAGWKHSWKFPEAAVHFIGSRLATLLSLLDHPIKPRPEVLIALRVDLSRCGCIIECRCHGLAELKRASFIDHFHRTDWLRFVTLEEILGRHENEERSVRRIA